MAQMASETCYKCGIAFDVPALFQRSCRADSNKTFYCPNGHPQHYATSEADKLRRERDALKQNTAYLEDLLRNAQLDVEAQKRQTAVYKGIATKIKNRVKHGVCPC